MALSFSECLIEEQKTVNHFKTKYGVVPSPNFRIVTASLEFPFRLFNFDGQRLPEKPRTERVHLIDEFLVFISSESEIPVSKFPVTAYWAQRRLETATLAKRLLGGSEISNPAFLDLLVRATTSKNAKLDDVHYERLEFVGDAVLTLLLSLGCASMSEFIERKSNAFLDEVARDFRLQDFIQDTAPTVNRRASLATRGLQHGEAKKVLADAVEATMAAIFLGADLKSCFQAGRSLGLFSVMQKSESLAEEFSIAHAKLVASVSVFTRFPTLSVGQLHLERERLVGSRKGKGFAREFPENLETLDAEIRNLAKNLNGSPPNSPPAKRPCVRPFADVETVEDAEEAVRVLEEAVKAAKTELDSRKQDLDTARVRLQTLQLSTTR